MELNSWFPLLCLKEFMGRVEKRISNFLLNQESWSQTAFLSTPFVAPNTLLEWLWQLEIFRFQTVNSNHSNDQLRLLTQQFCLKEIPFIKILQHKPQILIIRPRWSKPSGKAARIIAGIFWKSPKMLIKSSIQSRLTLRISNWIRYWSCAYSLQSLFL